MNFFCSSAEFDKYTEEMIPDKDTVIKCDVNKALSEAKDIFSVD